jgi:hypothetical protein
VLVESRAIVIAITTRQPSIDPNMSQICVTEKRSSISKDVRFITSPVPLSEGSGGVAARNLRKRIWPPLSAST